MRLLFALVALAALLPCAARATGFTDVDAPASTGETQLLVNGALRTRIDALHNLDLDRGLTPSGLPLFPVPAGDPLGQTLTGGDLRLRFDLGVVAPNGGFAVKVRADVLDNITLGGAAVGMPAATTTQRPSGAIGLKRAYGEAYTPFGVLSAGRMGSHWGLGLLANGGDCADCDSGDSVDRLAFLSPMLGHIVAAAYDFSATGPVAPRVDGLRPVDLAPRANVQSITFAILNWRSDRSRERRRKTGKTTFDYGAYFSRRTQEQDVPATWLPVAMPVGIDAAQVVPRDYAATAVDGWLRLVTPTLRVEVEAAMLLARIGQTSLLPGVLMRGEATSTQFGAALESEYGATDAAFRFGLDAGFASGDPAPGFGAFPAVLGPAPKAGELDGAQAAYPADLRADNFRFHSDYRIDRLLFREIIGTVTDVVYVRPHLRWRLIDAGPGSLTFSAAGVVSFAVEPTSTPNGTRPLGLELDPSLTWTHVDGFSIAFDSAVLFPLSAFDNAAQGLSARPAALARLRLNWGF